MPVSAGLQKYFDGRRKGSKDIGDKLKKIQDQLDPKFLWKFEDFRTRILTIVGEDPDAEDIVHEEIDILGSNLQDLGRKHSLKKASTLIRSSEIV